MIRNAIPVIGESPAVDGPAFEGGVPNLLFLFVETFRRNVSTKSRPHVWNTGGRVPAHP